MSAGDIKNPWYMTAFKILFFVVAFLAVIFTVLANINGNSDTFKGAIEDYMLGTTGYHAHVGTLNHAALFPNIIFDFEDMELRQKEEDTTPVVSVERIQIKFGFFDVVRGNGKLKDLNIEGVKALPGAILSRALRLDAFTVEDQDDGSALLLAKGAIGNDPFYAQSDIDVFGAGKKTSYGFGGKRHIEIRLGGLKAATDIDNGEIENLKIFLQEQEVMTGQLKMSESRRGLKLKGQLKLVQRGTVIEPDLVFDKSVLKGTVTSPEFHIEDVGGDSLLQKSIDEVERVLSGDAHAEKNVDLSHDMDVSVEIENFHVGKGSLGPIVFPVKIKDRALNIALSGKFVEGNLNGHIDLDATELPAILDIDMAIHHVDYGALQQHINENTQVSGRGDFVLKMKSEGRSGEALMRDLNGQATFIGGQGAFKSGAVNIWGGGLVSAILPDISPEEKLGVNCAIMDFKIEEGIANAETLFLDGKHVTIAGKGTYNIVEDDLDISLKPRPKDIAIGTVANAVNITGPLGNPSIAPSLFDFGISVGKVLLGTINPAFMAFSLADMGLNEKHPCHEFIGTPPESAAQ